MYQPPRHLAYLFPPPTGSVIDWRMLELSEILYRRDGACWIPDCNGHTTSSIHEAIVTRGDVQGWQPKSRRLEIFNGLNCIRLCDLHHNTALEPAREEIAAFMADLYGLDIVLDWLLSLEFRSRHPLTHWMEARRPTR